MMMSIWLRFVLVDYELLLNHSVVDDDGDDDDDLTNPSNLCQIEWYLFYW